MDDADRLVELTGFAARLTAAVGAAELGAATRFPDDAGFTIRFQADELWVAGRRLVSPTPAVVVDLATPLDAAVVCRAVGLQRPVGVSGDVHQHRWEVLVAGAPVPDPHAHRILVEPLRLGHWALRPLLAGRPAGALPQRVAGASPAYDVVAGSGSVVRLQVARREVWADILPAGHPHASVLLAGMARAAPSWRLGWDVSPEDPVVVVYDDSEPAAGAVLRLGEIAVASRLCAAPVSGEGDAGSSLLDVLEALALEHGCGLLRLDSSAFLASARVPWSRHGYRVGPDYAGDTDEPVWAERDLRPAWSPSLPREVRLSSDPPPRAATTAPADGAVPTSQQASANGSAWREGYSRTRRS